MDRGSFQHCDDFKFLMPKVIKNLKNAKKRIGTEKLESLQVLRDTLFQPDIGTVASSEHGISSGYEEMERDYFDEILLIEKVIEEEKLPIKLADWQKGKGGKEMMTSLNRRSIAIQLWEWYAIPLRCKGGEIYVIRSSPDVLGKPMIVCYNTEDVLALVGDKLSRLEVGNSKLSKKISGYLNVLVVLCFFLYTALAFKFPVFLNGWFVSAILIVAVGSIFYKAAQKYK